MHSHTLQLINSHYASEILFTIIRPIKHRDRNRSRLNTRMQRQKNNNNNYSSLLNRQKKCTATFIYTADLYTSTLLSDKDTVVDHLNFKQIIFSLHKCIYNIFYFSFTKFFALFMVMKIKHIPSHNF